MSDEEKTYHVTIEARVTKTITVKAKSKDDATEAAHSLFSCEVDESEYYEQDTVWVEMDEEGGGKYV